MSNKKYLSFTYSCFGFRSDIEDIKYRTFLVEEIGISEEEIKIRLDYLNSTHTPYFCFPSRYEQFKLFRFYKKRFNYRWHAPKKVTKRASLRKRKLRHRTV